VLFELGEAPGNAHGAEHGEVSGGVGLVGIEHVPSQSKRTPLIDENFLISIFDRLELTLSSMQNKKGAPERPFFHELASRFASRIGAHRQLRLPRSPTPRRRNPSKLKRAGVAKRLTLFLLLKVFEHFHAGMMMKRSPNLKGRVARQSKEIVFIVFPDELRCNPPWKRNCWCDRLRCMRLKTSIEIEATWKLT